MAQCSFPQVLSTVVADNISILSIINASGGGVLAQIFLHCSLGNQNLVLDVLSLDFTYFCDLGC